MTTYNKDHSLDLRETAEGIAMRAGILSVAALLIGGWLLALGAKAAGGLMKVLAGALLLAVGGFFAWHEVKKVQDHFAGDESQPQAE